MTRKSGLDSGRCPPTVVLNKDGKLYTGTGSPFRGLAEYPVDLVNYEVGSFDVVKDEDELREVIERVGRAIGKVFNADAAIADAMLPAPVRARDENADRWASQALHPGFLMY